MKPAKYTFRPSDPLDSKIFTGDQFWHFPPGNNEKKSKWWHLEMTGDAELLTGDPRWYNFYRGLPRWTFFPRVDATGALSRDVTSVSVSFIEDHHALWQSTQSCFSIQIIFLSRSGSIRGENPFSKWRTGLGSFQDLCGFWDLTFLILGFFGFFWDFFWILWFGILLGHLGFMGLFFLDYWTLEFFGLFFWLIDIFGIFLGSFLWNLGFFGILQNSFNSFGLLGFSNLLGFPFAFPNSSEFHWEFWDFWDLFGNFWDFLEFCCAFLRYSGSFVGFFGFWYFWYFLYFLWIFWIFFLGFVKFFLFFFDFWEFWAFFRFMRFLGFLRNYGDFLGLFGIFLWFLANFGISSGVLGFDFFIFISWDILEIRDFHWISPKVYGILSTDLPLRNFKILRFSGIARTKKFSGKPLCPIGPKN